MDCKLPTLSTYLPYRDSPQRDCGRAFGYGTVPNSFGAICLVRHVDRHDFTFIRKSCKTAVTTVEAMQAAESSRRE